MPSLLFNTLDTYGVTSGFRLTVCIDCVSCVLNLRRNAAGNLHDEGETKRPANLPDGRAAGNRYRLEKGMRFST